MLDDELPVLTPGPRLVGRQAWPGASGKGIIRPQLRCLIREVLSDPLVRDDVRCGLVRRLAEYPGEPELVPLAHLNDWQDRDEPVPPPGQLWPEGGKEKACPRFVHNTPGTGSKGPGPCKDCCQPEPAEAALMASPLASPSNDRKDRHDQLTPRPGAQPHHR